MPKRDPFDVRFDPATIRNRSVRGAGVTAVAQALKLCLQLGSQIALARLLDPAQFGLIAMVAPVLGLVLALNDFGLGQAIVQRNDITPKQVSALFWLNICIGGGLALIGVASAPLVAALYGEPRTSAIMMVSALLIMFSSASVVPLSLLNRQMRFGPLAVVDITALISGAMAGIAAAYAGWGYWSLVVLQCANAVVTLVLSWIMCGWWPGRPAREPGVGELARFGVNVMGSNLASYISMSADNVIIGVMNGKVALGLYDRSYNLVVKPLTQVMAPAGRVAVPMLSRLQDSPERYSRAYVLLLQLMTATTVPGLIVTIVVAQPLIFLLLGPKWTEMVPVFSWICFGGIASAISASTYWLFTTQNRTDELVRFSGIVAAISVASFAIGAFWGVVGVAMVSALSFILIQTPIMVWAATRKGSITMATLWRASWPLAAAGLLAAAITYPLAHALTDVPAGTLSSTASRAAALVAVYVAGYVAFALGLLMQPDGRLLIKQARELMRSR